MSGIGENEFVTFFNQQYRSLRNFAYYKTGDADVADDVAQETFSKIWEKRETIKKETMKSLAFTIASNLCKNKFEHQRVVLEFASSFKPVGNEISPEFEMEMNEFNEQLKKAINGLNEKNKVVFLMNRIDGFTYAEIAKSLELSVKAIEKRMKNALYELKKSIEFKL